MAGASVALGGLQNLAMASSRPTGAADLRAGLSGEPQSGAESSTNAPEYTRGIGVYPGNPREDFSPVLVLEG
jgi:hypothetical protein